MLIPGQHHQEDHHEADPAKVDRWLVGLVAGAALMYLLGKAMGLGHGFSLNRNVTIPGHDRHRP